MFTLMFQVHFYICICSSLHCEKPHLEQNNKISHVALYFHISFCFELKIASEMLQFIEFIPI